MVKLFSRHKDGQYAASRKDVYQYDHLPEPFRGQVVHLLIDAIGHEVRSSVRLSEPAPDRAWHEIHEAILRKRGDFYLCRPGEPPMSDCANFIMSGSTNDVLDLITVAFSIVDTTVRRTYNFHDIEIFKIKIEPDEAIDALNMRFKEHKIGYVFTNGKLIRIESEYLHSEAVTPALSLLHEQNFSGAEEEFLKAHEQYREGNHKDAIANANKAFESVMKTICAARKWPVDPKATARHLIDAILKNGLVPQYMQDHLTGLSKVLEAGLPTVRNKTSGHGQGVSPVVVEQYVANYALNLAATNIVFLIESHKAMP